MDATGTRYLLADLVNQAYSKEVVAHTDLDKEVIKLDDRVNAMFLVQSGGMAVIFPDPGSENHKWISVSERLMNTSREGSDSIGTIFLRYLNSIRIGDYAGAQSRLTTLMNYQEDNETLLPSDTQMNMEIRYNKIRIFPRLALFYGLFGVLMMVLQFILVFRPRKTVRTLFRIGVVLFGIAFLIHMMALALRWYLSGHAPTSNGYESMILVSWVTILAGLIFVRRSGYVIGLTGILAFLALMVAGMSNMNPEITNLVPVLKSPWLTIHVTVIMAGYGFLGLASILGLLNLVLYSSLTGSNRQRVGDVIANVTNVNHLTMIVGLYFMTIGMFMGGIWANESWGRYWGWDPKETWALITVLVYAFVTHMHKIPGMRGTFAFNLASLIGYGSVLMTYFGVNYFLGGIHSYAQGTAFKVPAGIYMALAVLIGLGIFAYTRQRSLLPDSPNPEGQNGQ
jgi:cytochrome c-type biogenesis protein CcsB